MGGEQTLQEGEGEWEEEVTAEAESTPLKKLASFRIAFAVWMAKDQTTL